MNINLSNLLLHKNHYVCIKDSNCFEFSNNKKHRLYRCISSNLSVKELAIITLWGYAALALQNW